MPGTLTKAEIVNTIQHENGYSRTKATELVESLLELIKGTLESGEDVLFRDLANLAFNPRKNDGVGIRLPVKI